MWANLKHVFPLEFQYRKRSRFILPLLPIIQRSHCLPQQIARIPASLPVLIPQQVHPIRDDSREQMMVVCQREEPIVTQDQNVFIIHGT